MDAAAREEERESLEAIYGEDFCALGPSEWRVLLCGGRAWLNLSLPEAYPGAPPVARLEAAGAPLPEAAAAAAAAAVEEAWAPGECCAYSCCVALEERLRALEDDAGGGAAPEEDAEMGKCTVPVEAEVAAVVGPSLVEAGFQSYPGGLYSHLTKAITVYLGEELTVTVDGIEAEDLTDWLGLRLQEPGDFGAGLLEWAEAQRSEEPGFAEGAQAAASSGLDFLPKPEELGVDRERKLTIMTWGKAFRKLAPPESQANFNAGILNGRGGGADIRVDNGLTEAVQRNVASCGLFPRWLEMVIKKIETEGLAVVSINCTKGRHRSVAAAEILKREYYPSAATVHTSPAIKR